MDSSPELLLNSRLVETTCQENLLSIAREASSCVVADTFLATEQASPYPSDDTVDDIVPQLSTAAVPTTFGAPSSAGLPQFGISPEVGRVLVSQLDRIATALERLAAASEGRG